MFVAVGEQVFKKRLADGRRRKSPYNGAVARRSGKCGLLVSKRY